MDGLLVMRITTMEYWKPRCYFRFVCKNKNVIVIAIYDRRSVSN